MSAILAGVLVLSVTSGGNPGDSEAASFAAAACRQARDSIVTIRATVDSVKVEPVDSPSGGKSIPSRGYEWWQSGDQVRCRIRNDPSDVVTVRRNGLNKRLYTNASNKGKVIYNGSLAPLAEDDTNAPFWMDALYVIPTRPFPAAYHVFDADKFDRIATEAINGRKLCRVDFHMPQVSRGIVWLDPSRNYLAVKWDLDLGSDGRESRQVCEAGAVREVQPGFFFPSEVFIKTPRDGTFVVWRKSVIRNVSVNKPISPELFDLKFPPGTAVSDATKGTVYVTDAEERPRTGESPLPAANRTSANAATLGRSHAFSLAAWALAAAVGLASLLAVWALVLRKKA